MYFKFNIRCSIIKLTNVDYLHYQLQVVTSWQVSIEATTGIRVKIYNGRVVIPQQSLLGSCHFRRSRLGGNRCCPPGLLRGDGGGFAGPICSLGGRTGHGAEELGLHPASCTWSIVVLGVRQSGSRNGRPRVGGRAGGGGGGGELARAT